MPRERGSEVRSRGLLLGFLIACSLVFPAGAMAASPPSITSSFTPSTIGVSGTSTLSFTIANGGTAALTGINFTDTLPAGVVVDYPNGVSVKCGTGATMTANSGSGTISFSGGQLAPGANCTVSANVTSSTAGIYQNDTGTVGSDQGAGNSDIQSLTVVAPPSVTIAAPTNGSTFTLGQPVNASYSCQDATNGPGISDCQGDVPNGSAINTATPGHKTFTVTAFSSDGQITNRTVRYTVLPSNQFTVWQLDARPLGNVIFDIRVPDGGTLGVVVRAQIKGSSSLFGQLVSKRLAGRGAYGVVVHPSSAGKRLFDQAWKANPSGAHPAHEVIAFTLTVTFTPTGGTAKSVPFQGLRLSP